MEICLNYIAKLIAVARSEAPDTHVPMPERSASWPGWPAKPRQAVGTHGAF